MYRFIITLVTVLTFTQLSLQTSLPNNEKLAYSVKNLSPPDAQKIDVVKISDSSKPNLEKRTSLVSDLSSPTFSIENWPNYVVGYVNLSYPNVDSVICLSESTFCCRFEIYLQNFTTGVNINHYIYRYGVFQAQDDVKNPNTLCSVFRCASDDLADCNRDITTNTDVVFQKINITAKITKSHEYLLEASSFTANILPLPESNYEWHEFTESEFYGVQNILTTTAANIYSFAINATGNSIDTGIVEDGEDDGAAALAVSMFIMFSILLSNILI